MPLKSSPATITESRIAMTIRTTTNVIPWLSFNLNFMSPTFFIRKLQTRACLLRGQSVIAEIRAGRHRNARLTAELDVGVFRLHCYGNQNLLNRAQTGRKISAAARGSSSREAIRSRGGAGSLLWVVNKPNRSDISL